MNSLRYLLLHTLKNTLKQLVRNPAKLVITLLVVAFMAFSIWLGMTSDHINIAGGERLGELFAMVLALYLLIFVITAKNGFNNGASFYSMADVNLLFTGPFSPQKVLVYGLIRQMGLSLWVGFFLLFQYNWLHNTYGLTIRPFLFIIFGYCLVFFCGHVTAMGIYAATAGGERRKRFQNVLYVCVLVLLLAVVAPVLLSGQWGLAGLVTAANAAWLDYLPVIGWTKAAFSAVYAGRWLPALAFLAADVLYVIVLVQVITKSGSDYYEDVLSATEAAYRLRSETQQGKVAENVTGEVKLGKTGIHKGWGPSVFYHKHMLENRRSKLYFYDTTSLIFTVMTLVFCFFLRNEGILPVFVFASYTQIFALATQRWVRELTRPYVYLIPAKPFAKLLAIMREGVLKSAVDAVITFGLVGLILQLSPLQTACCIVARFGFALVLTGGNLLTERLTGGISSKVITMVLYFLLLMVVAAPGVILAVVLTAAWGGDIYGGLIITFVWNVIAALALVWFCRNLLRRPEVKTV